MHPVLFTLELPGGAPLTLYSYGLMLGLAVVAGWRLTVHMGQRHCGLDEELLGGAYFSAVVAGLVGGRAAHLLLYGETPGSDSGGLLNLAGGGSSAHGALAAALLGAWLYLRRKGTPLKVFLDASAPAMGLGMALGSIGCYLHGCDFGVALAEDAPGWLASLGTFPNGSPAFDYHVDRYGIASDADSAMPVHPAQLEAALAGLVLLWLSLRLVRRRSFPGQVGLATLAGYGALRFGLEYVREDVSFSQPFGFSIPQLLSLLLLAAAALTLLAQSPTGLSSA